MILHEASSPPSVSPSLRPYYTPITACGLALSGFTVANLPAACGQWQRRHPPRERLSRLQPAARLLSGRRHDPLQLRPMVAVDHAIRHVHLHAMHTAGACQRGWRFGRTLRGMTCTACCGSPTDEHRMRRYAIVSDCRGICTACRLRRVNMTIDRQVTSLLGGCYRH